MEAVVVVVCGSALQAMQAHSFPRRGLSNNSLMAAGVEAMST